jgi:UV DNA damage endonuclease
VPYSVFRILYSVFCILSSVFCILSSVFFSSPQPLPIPTTRRLGFAVKVLGRGGLKSHDTRRWQSRPDLGVSLELLREIFDYLTAERISMYRISSDFIPYATHPEMPQFHRQLDEYAVELGRMGRIANEKGLRLSLHPSQYVVLNARDESIVQKSIADLDSQAKLLDALGQGGEGVVVLHIGGVYGDKQTALERFVANYQRLSEPARRRLVIENDDVAFTVRDCLWVHGRTGLRVVFDHQHHRLNPGAMPLLEAAHAALETWPDPQIPKIHFSSARLDGRILQKGKQITVQPPLLRQHADYIDPWTFAEFLERLGDRKFDVMLEAKAKDLALLKLRDDLEVIGRERVLLQPT